MKRDALEVRLVAEVRLLRRTLERAVEAVDDLAAMLDLDDGEPAELVLLDVRAVCTCKAGGPSCRRHGRAPV